MKRVYCLTVFILLLCLPFLLSAQLPKGVVVNTGNGSGNAGGGAEFWSPTTSEIDGCNLSHTFRLAVFNLDLLNSVDYTSYLGNAALAPDLDLPGEYGPMYIRCQLNGHVEVVEVESFSLVPMLTGGYAFVFDHTMTIDVSKDCMFKNNSTAQVYGVSMFLESAEGLEYPICDYTSTNDLFDCNYFPAECPMNNCINEDWTQWYGTIKFFCNDECLTYEPNYPESTESSNDEVNGEDSDSKVRNDSDLKYGTMKPLEIFPNPFQSELNIRWNRASEKSIIQLYNSNGQLLKSWIDTEYRADETLKVDTNDLPKGIYFLQIRSNGDIKHYKLLKA